MEEQTKTKKRILIFTDSRGQHKPAGQNHDIFAERLAKDNRLDVDMYLCPMKWTTTLDFLERFSPEQLQQYDAVFLYTGIVEWSPRPARSAQNDLYDNKISANESAFGENTLDYARKIINNKKNIFDQVFGESEMAQHLSSSSSVMYEGEKTNNMYNLEMAHQLIERLKGITNLVFISANKFISGWEGDFKRGRPRNISMTHSYSDVFATELKASGKKVIDLRDWREDDIKKYTCDNIHLTRDGSDYIYGKIMDHLGLEESHLQPTNEFSPPDHKFEGFPKIERIGSAKHDAVKKSAGTTDEYLATLIIGVRHNPDNPKRLENLKFLLRWIDFYYEELFDVLIIEQDSESHISLEKLGAKQYVRHEFIYNPSEYNRGWCYNVAVKHFCEDAKVVALMDVDVLTGANFLRDIMDCHSRIDVSSPYMNIYYTDEDEAKRVMDSMSLSHLNDEQSIKNPVTISGGVVIWNRSSYLASKGYEQYVGYSSEDRAMDVTIFNHIEKDRIRIAPQTYVHLYHDKDANERIRFKEIYGHLTTEYKCQYDPNLGPFDFIHTNCEHVSKEKTLELMLARTKDFGDPELYRSGDPLTVNGLRAASPSVHPSKNIILPPDFAGFDGYKEREVYKNVPDPDRSELAQFHNRYLGQRCFVIGNGPSLNKHDLSLLENEYAFGVNSFYYKTRETGYRPNFYVVEDSSVMKENIEEIRAYDAPFKFFPTIYKSLHPKKANTFFFEMNRGFYEKTSPNYAVPRFSTDATDVLYCGQSVTYINLQLAYFMGFTEVYLIGMDFDYVIPESHKRTGDVLLSDTDDPNHFHKDYFGAGKSWKDPKLERVLMNYKMADLAFSAVGRKIYNATVGGKLEVFDRVDYEALLTKPGSNNAVAVSKPKPTVEIQQRSAGSDEARSASEILYQIASELLLTPDKTADRISNGDLKSTLEGALSQVSSEDLVRLHFEKVKSHVMHTRE